MQTLVRKLNKPLALPTLPVDRIATLPWLSISYYAVALWFVVCKCYALIGVTPRTFFDTTQSTPEIAGYFGVARESLFSLSFWAAHRAPGYPLVCKMLGCNPGAIVLFQALASVAGWGALAYAVTRHIRTPDLRPIAAWFVVAFSLTVHVTQWDGAVSTESLSLSLFALLLATVLMVAELATVRRVAALCAVAAAWVALRDTHAFALLFCLPVLAVVGFRARHWWMVAGVFTVLSGASMVSADKGERHLFSLYNNIGMKVLPSKTNTEYFQRAGMPASPALLGRAGTYGAADNFHFYRSPELTEFRAWVKRDGKRTYAKWMLSDLRRFAFEPFGIQAFMTLTPNATGSTPTGLRTTLPQWAATSLYSIYPRDVLTAVGVALLGAVALLRRRRGVWLLPLTMMATAPILSILCYWGDAMEPVRHCLGAGVQFQLGMWLMLLMVADALKPTLVRRVDAPGPQSARRLPPLPELFAGRPRAAVPLPAQKP